MVIVEWHILVINEAKGKHVINLWLKCRSAVKTVLKYMQRLKNGSQNKIIVGFEAIFNVFLGSDSPKMAPLEEALPGWAQSSSLYFWNQ